MQLLTILSRIFRINICQFVGTLTRIDEVCIFHLSVFTTVRLSMTPATTFGAPVTETTLLVSVATARLPISSVAAHLSVLTECSVLRSCWLFRFHILCSIVEH